MNGGNQNNNRHDISIMSMNCRGLADAQKRRDVMHYLKKKKHSIFCLQDVHFDKELEKKVQIEWGLDCHFCSFKTNARGVAILFNNNFDYKVHNSKTDENGNLLALDLEIEGFRLSLISIYGPNSDTPTFYDKVENIISDYDNPHTIICGDWNLVMNETLDSINYVRLNNPNARKRVLKLCKDLNLTDSWRIQNPDTKSYTWMDHD